ncbi:MAG: 6-aminohexanoate hydrolase, partial [Halofilum sp. (in: g-proteobacteria)]
LTEASGRSVLALGRDWIGAPLDIRIPAWDQDPQGIYFGGNNMLLSPRALVQLGELYRNDGMVDGQRVLPRGWVESSWSPRVRSPWSGDQYGFGWFIRRVDGLDIYHGRGYGGQMLYVVPALELTVAISADPSPPSPPGSAVDRLHAVLEQHVIPVLREHD